MIYLMVLGVLAVIFGAFLLMCPECVRNICRFFDEVIMYLDNIASPSRYFIGLLMLALGGWLAYLGFSYPEWWVVHPIWVILAIFGLLYLFFPRGLKLLSDFFNATVIQTDEVVLNQRRSIGIFFIVAGIYIIIIAYLSR